MHARYDSRFTESTNEGVGDHEAPVGACPPPGSMWLLPHHAHYALRPYTGWPSAHGFLSHPPTRRDCPQCGQLSGATPVYSYRPIANLFITRAHELRDQAPTAKEGSTVVVLRPNNTNLIGQMRHLARLDTIPTTSGPHHCHGRDKLALYTATEPNPRNRQILVKRLQDSRNSNDVRNT